MNEVQESTVRKIIAAHQNLHDCEAKKVTINGKEMLFPCVNSNIRFYYKTIENDKILFGIGNGVLVSDTYIIEIKELQIIETSGEILDKSNYNSLEIELTKDEIEINMFNTREDLILFKI